MQLNGQYFDGQTSTSREIHLDLDEQGLLHAEPALFSPLSIKDLQFSSRVANVPRILTLPSGATIETSDHETLEGWLSRHEITHGIAYKIENSMKHVLSALVFVVLFITWTWFYGIPWFSKIAADTLPEEVSIAIGEGAFDTMDERFFAASELDQEHKTRLLTQFEKLLPEQDADSEMQYQLLFRQSDLVGANAFALPNGAVVVTDELVNLAEHDEEIISVLLHEIGHVEKRHSLRLLISHSGLAVLTVLVTGDVNSAGALVLAMPNVLMNSAYSRDIEWEADSYALEQMQRTGIPPSRFADFMEKLEAYVPEAIEEDDTSVEDSGKEEQKAITDDVNNNAAGTSSTASVANQGKECTPSSSESGKIEYRLDMSWVSYISTHPPTRERISRFREVKE